MFFVKIYLVEKCWLFPVHEWFSFIYDHYIFSHRHISQQKEKQLYLLCWTICPPFSANICLWKEQVFPFSDLQYSTFSYQVAKELRADSYGLIFGINMFVALFLQSILTFVVVQVLEIGVKLQVRSFGEVLKISISDFYYYYFFNIGL